MVTLLIHGPDPDGPDSVLVLFGAGRYEGCGKRMVPNLGNAVSHACPCQWP